MYYVGVIVAILILGTLVILPSNHCTRVLTVITLRWLVYGFTIKIKMLVLATALPTAFLKESAFTKHLLIYLFQQTKVFDSGLNVS